MLKQFFIKLAFILVLSFVFLGGSVYSQTTTKTKSANMYTQWIKMALLGKNQAEIEYFFRNSDSKTMETIKKRIRNAVLGNLKRSGIVSMINKRSDMDDINTVIQKIVVEIRYAGMEQDEDLKLSIKEEFGISLERL